MSKWGWTALAFAAGACAGLGHAPFGLWPIALLGFGVLAFAVATSGRPVVTAWSGGAGYFGLTLHWIVEPFLVDAATHGWMAPFALVLLAGGLALLWAVAGWLAARLAGPMPVTWAITLTLMEVVRGHLFTGFPWALPAYIWTDTDVRMTAALWGPYGLTFVTLMLVSLPSLAPSRLRAAGFAAVSAFGVAALFLGAGAIAPPSEGETAERVVILHPGVPQADKWDPLRVQENVTRQIAFTAEGTGEDNVALVVWPETAVPYVLDRSASVLREMSIAAGGVPVLTGINRRDGERWYNSSVLIDADGTVVETYDKVHLVPFGEYIPFRLDFLRAMAARSTFGFSAGEDVRTISTPLGEALVLICYEAIFPGHIRRSDSRPDYLIQITNDAWFGTFAGPFQHLQQAQFRAAEQGLPMVRATNMGVSAMIDARGAVTARMEQGDRGWFDATMPAALPPTIYARMGDIPLIGVLLALAAVLWFRARRNAIAKAPTLK
ncbi:MAG: apolipoprotein N-acyltransferase [Pseudomonadota bacterium]